MFHASRISSGILCRRFLLKKDGGGFACLLVLAFISMLCETAEAGDPLRYRAGLRLSAEKNKLNNRERKAVLDSLRKKTGLPEMGFDEDGFLSLGDAEEASGGSETARALLLAAMNLSCAIDIEAHNNSMEIAFGRLDKPVHFTNFSSGDQIEVYPIQIDFSDFRKLRGDKRVIAAFDIGFVILHELGHAVLGLQDTFDSIDTPGECEDHINRIRLELGYPVRENYIAKLYNRSRFSHSMTESVAELHFTWREGDGKGTERFILNWPAREVGPIVRGFGVRRPQAPPSSIALN